MKFNKQKTKIMFHQRPPKSAKGNIFLDMEKVKINKVLGYRLHKNLNNVD